MRYPQGDLMVRSVSQSSFHDFVLAAEPPLFSGMPFSSMLVFSFYVLKHL